MMETTQRQTIKQFVAAVKQIAGDDVRHQTNAWPYPQASQSHIAFWRESWPHKLHTMPNRRICVSVVDSDCPGVLMRVATDAPTPSEVASMLAE